MKRTHIKTNFVVLLLNPIIECIGIRKVKEWLHDLLCLLSIKATRVSVIDAIYQTTGPLWFAGAVLKVLFVAGLCDFPCRSSCQDCIDDSSFASIWNKKQNKESSYIWLLAHIGDNHTIATIINTPTLYHTWVLV